MAYIIEEYNVKIKDYVICLGKVKYNIYVDINEKLFNLYKFESLNP